MGFLDKLSELRKATPVNKNPVIKPQPNKEQNSDVSLLPKNYIRDEDPAVRRLKEKRRLERIKNGELLEKSKRIAEFEREKKAKKSRENKVMDKMGSLGTVYKRKVGSNIVKKPPIIKKREPVKKLSFEELMRQAEENKTVKQKENPVTIKSTTSTTVKRTNPTLNKPGFKSRHRQISREERPQTSQQSKTPPVRVSLPKNQIAQPNARIKKRLESRKGKHSHARTEYNYHDESDSDMDDFIEDDEDEDSYVDRNSSGRRSSSRDIGYDRDEIWAMFNKGRRRDEYADDYDDYGNDMEANEMEIMEEEEYAGRMARLEDKREAAWLKKHEEEKRRNKQHR